MDQRTVMSIVAGLTPAEQSKGRDALGAHPQEKRQIREGRRGGVIERENEVRLMGREEVRRRQP
jgi:hypothetical protein